MAQNALQALSIFLPIRSIRGLSRDRGSRVTFFVTAEVKVLQYIIVLLTFIQLGILLNRAKLFANNQRSKEFCKQN